MGKTTCAAGLALAAARAGTPALVVSTDPAASLGDAFRLRLGASPRPVPVRHGLLDAVEIDAAAALARWLRSRRAALHTIALRGTWLDDQDVGRLLRLSLPGIDELAALLEVSRLAASRRYGLVVVDTAPTGHTLRMLQTPAALGALADVFDHMQARHRTVVQALRGGWRPDAEDAVVAGMEAEAAALGEMLRDPARTHVSWVTLPEAMAVEETVDAAAALAAAGIPLNDVIVNRITPPPDRPCRWCDARRAFEHRSLASIRRRLPGIPLVPVAARTFEPRGVRALAAIGSEIRARGRIEPWPAGRRRPAPRPAAKAAAARAIDLPAGADARLLIFGGKGGVGKTTCAAAAALALARALPLRRLLLMSADPAHSLADALGVRLSGTARVLPGGPGNLRVRELDAARGFQQLRDRYAQAVDRWFDSLSRGDATGLHVDAGPDRRIMHRLLRLAPPGIDELAAVIEVTDALEAGVDLVVMDTAPSGHALRLLEMPALVQEWTRALMAILLKYQPLAPVGELGAALLRVSQGLGRLRSLLADPRRTAFIVVTRAAALPVDESCRLIERLSAMPVQVPLLLVNAVGRGTCTRCRREAAAEARALRRIDRMAAAAGRGVMEVGEAPGQLPPPHGTAELKRWRATWTKRPSTR